MDLQILCRDAALRALLFHIEPALSAHPHRNAGRSVVITDHARDCTLGTIVVVNLRKPGEARSVSLAIRENRLGGAVTIDRLERDLSAAVDAVSAGLLAFSPGLFAELERMTTLSRRQEQILTLVARGLPNSVVAQRLQVSRSTVKREISEMLTVLSCANRSQLAAQAAEMGYLHAPRPAAVRR